jgi:hypothetical protein
MVMPTEPVRDIMRRTMKNLEFVEDHAGVNGPYEVTQLLNSFLGALAHPWESLRADFDVMPISEALDQGWPRIAKERPGDCEPESLGTLLRFMRNALAHGNMEFLPDASGDIQAIRIWNNDRGRRNWGATITVADMRAFLTGFVALAEDLHEQQSRSRPRTA